jgi:cytochrome c5
MVVMTWVRRIGAVLAALVVIVLLGAASVFAVSESKISKKIPVPVEPALALSADPAVLARGEHVATALAKCTACHNGDLGGGVVVNDPAAGHIEASNLTTGKGGVLAQYSDVTLERAIRHGVGYDDRALLLMPSDEFSHLSNDDISAIIAYLHSRPATDRVRGDQKVGPVLRTLWATGKVHLAPAEVINQTAPHLAAAPLGNSVEAGRYIAENGCMGCHGSGLSGGPIPGAPPSWKPAANLTPTGIGPYSLDDFRTILRTGKRPSGVMVDTLMPVPATKLMTDEEIESVYKFLKTVPPKEYGNR